MQTSRDGLLVMLGGLHHISAGIGATAPLFAAGLRLREYRRGDRAAGVVAYALARLSIRFTLLAMAIGGVMLAMHWLDATGPYRGALERVAPRRYAFAVGELAFYFLTMGPYVVLWQRFQRRPYLHGALALLAATNILYHFPPLMVMLSVLASRPELADTVLDRDLYRTLFSDAEVISRVVHWWVASLAVAAIAQLYVAARKAASGELDTHAANMLAAWAARIALAAIVLQVATGIWVLLAVTPAARAALIGGDFPAMTFLLAGIGVMVALLQQLIPVALGEAASARRAALLTCAVVILMTAASRRVRDLPAGSPVPITMTTVGASGMERWTLSH